MSAGVPSNLQRGAGDARLIAAIWCALERAGPGPVISAMAAR